MKDKYQMRYRVVHLGERSEVYENGSPIEFPIATFNRAGSSQWAAYADQFARILNGHEFYKDPPTEEYIRDHSYDHHDIHRLAITSRNETIDELRNTILVIARMFGMPGGWGMDYEHLFARIQERIGGKE